MQQVKIKLDGQRVLEEFKNKLAGDTTNKESERVMRATNFSQGNRWLVAPDTRMMSTWRPLETRNQTLEADSLTSKTVRRTMDPDKLTASRHEAGYTEQ